MAQQFFNDLIVKDYSPISDKYNAMHNVSNGFIDDNRIWEIGSPEWAKNLQSKIQGEQTKTKTPTDNTDQCE